MSRFTTDRRSLKSSRRLRDKADLLQTASIAQRARQCVGCGADWSPDRDDDMDRPDICDACYRESEDEVRYDQERGR